MARSIVLVRRPTPEGPLGVSVPIMWPVPGLEGINRGPEPLNKASNAFGVSFTLGWPQ